MSDASDGPLSETREVRGAIGLLIEDQEILLVANLRDIGRGEEMCWDLPGGTVRPHESTEAACAREFHEETGLEVKVEDLAFIVERFGSLGRPSDQRSLYFFFHVARTTASATIPKGQESPMDPAITGTQWATESQVLTLCTQSYHNELKTWLCGGRNQRYFLTGGSPSTSAFRS